MRTNTHNPLGGREHVRREPSPGPTPCDGTSFRFPFSCTTSGSKTFVLHPTPATTGVGGLEGDGDRFDDGRGTGVGVPESQCRVEGTDRSLPGVGQDRAPRTTQSGNRGGPFSGSRDALTFRRLRHPVPPHPSPLGCQWDTTDVGHYGVPVWVSEMLESGPGGRDYRGRSDSPPQRLRRR